MRELLKIQEGMDLCLDQRDKEPCQLRSQSQSDGAQLAVLSLQMQELISSVESRAEVVGKDLEEINGQFDHHRGEINCLKIREKDSKEEVKKLKGFIVGAGHEAQVFKNCKMRVGRSCPMHLSERTSMLLLLWRTPCPSLFQPWFLHVALAPWQLLFLPWRRLWKKLLSSVMTWTAC